MLFLSCMQLSPRHRKLKLLGLGLVVMIVCQICVGIFVYSECFTMFGLYVINHNSTMCSGNLRRSIFGKSSSEEGSSLSKSASHLRVPPCPDIPPDLDGPFPVLKEVLSWAVIEALNKHVEYGGRYKPRNCTSGHRVAIIVPYRDREIHLKIFLTNIHLYLRNQQIDYGLYIVELAQEVPFNRALLLNVGFLEASKLYDYTCFIFHDVDLIPEDDRNRYICLEEPRHMSVAVDKFHYRLPYPRLFGGASAMTKEQFEMVNGFSNLYFGWGGEDDDMSKRLSQNNFSIIRYPPEIARYQMIAHIREELNPKILDILKTSKERYKVDGLNSLKYTRLKLELRRLYTWILVTVNQTEISKSFKQSSAPVVPFN